LIIIFVIGPEFESLLSEKYPPPDPPYGPIVLKQLSYAAKKVV
jgi:hypothetical protein